MLANPPNQPKPAMGGQQIPGQNPMQKENPMGDNALDTTGQDMPPNTPEDNEEKLALLPNFNPRKANNPTIIIAPTI